MSILNDKWIDQVTLKLCEEYPLLDFSFQDGYTEEMKLILEAARRETLKRVKQLFLGYLTVDSETNDRRRKEFNQAIFSGKEGYAVFNGTDLGMVMEKFDMALKEGE